MGHRSPEQINFQFPEEDKDNAPDSDAVLLEKIKDRMRHEPAYMNLPPDDPVIDFMAKIRLEQVKKKAPTVKYHDHFRD